MWAFRILAVSKRHLKTWFGARFRVQQHGLKGDFDHETYWISHLNKIFFSKDARPWNLEPVSFLGGCPTVGSPPSMSFHSRHDFCRSFMVTAAVSTGEADVELLGWEDSGGFKWLHLSQSTRLGLSVAIIHRHTYVYIYISQVTACNSHCYFLMYIGTIYFKKKNLPIYLSIYLSIYS